MALALSGTNQSLQATVSLPVYPYTFMSWVRRSGTISNNEDTLISVGQAAQDLAFHDIQCFYDTNTRLATFLPFTSPSTRPVITVDSTYHLVIGIVTATTIQIFTDNVAGNLQAYTPDTATLDLVTIARTARSTDSGHTTGWQEHVAMWNIALTESQMTQLYERTVNPATIQPANLLTYVPLVSNLTPAYGSITFTPINLGTPSFVSSGLNYPPVHPGITVNHLNYDPSSRSASDITNAAALKVYFEHASTGQDIVGNSDTDSTTGVDSQGALPCGLALLYASNNRYLCNRESFDTSNDYTWYASNNGLQDNHRGNPTPALKVSGFLGLSANMRAAVDVAMFKFCWIDVWPATEGYVTDGAAFAASLISQMETFELANPDVICPYWTMPLQSTEAYEQRDIFNTAIRNYCTANQHYLIDIADIENYNAENVQAADIGGFRAADSIYTIADGGHLSTAGKLKMAQAYWTTLAHIANGAIPPSTLSGITRDKNGQPLASCTVSCWKRVAGVWTFVGETTSNASTGAWSFSVPDTDPNYMVYAFKADTPHIFDASDYVLQPV